MFSGEQAAFKAQHSNGHILNELDKRCAIEHEEDGEFPISFQSEEATSLVESIIETGDLTTEVLEKFETIADFRYFVSCIARECNTPIRVLDPVKMIEFLLSTLSTCQNLLRLDLLYEFLSYCLLEQLFPPDSIQPIITFAMRDLVSDYNCNLFVNICEMYPSEAWIEPSFSLRPDKFCTACIGFLRNKLLQSQHLPRVIARILQDGNPDMFTFFHMLVQMKDDFGITRQFLDDAGITKALIDTLNAGDQSYVRKAYIFFGLCVCSGIEMPQEALQIAMEHLEFGAHYEKEEIIKMFASVIYSCDQETISKLIDLGLLDRVIDMIHGDAQEYASKCCLDLYNFFLAHAPDLVISKLSPEITDSLQAIADSNARTNELAAQILRQLEANM